MCADYLVGDDSKPRGETAWRQVYRSLDHKHIAERFREGTILKFPDEIKDFSVFFRKLQIRREESDYNHVYSLYRGSAEADIGLAKRHIEAISKLDEKHLRALAAYILLRGTRHQTLDAEAVKLPKLQEKKAKALKP